VLDKVEGQSAAQPRFLITDVVVSPAFLCDLHLTRAGGERPDGNTATTRKAAWIG